MSTTTSSPVESASSRRLHKSGIGILPITLFVIAAASPLTVVVGAIPITIGNGAGAGVPVIFLIAGLVYLIFAVGYGAMAQHIGNAGAFYTFITQGLGRPFGVGGALLALLAYSAVQAGVYGAFGYFMQDFISSHFQLALPWWVYALACALLVQWIGGRRINLSGKVLSGILVLEASILLVVDIAILVNSQARPPLDLASFHPSAIFNQGFGASMVFVIAAYIGFEATAIFAEEARDPRRTVPRATYLAVILITLFYMFCSWAIIEFYGSSAIAEAARAHPATLWTSVSYQLIGAAPTLLMNILVLTGMFACILAFHNSITRYLFSLSREDVLWEGLSRTHAKHQSPHMAGRSQTAFAIALIVICALCSLDPYNVVFAWFSGLAALAIVALQLLAAIAIYRYFARNPFNHRLWTRRLAPLLSIILLAAVTVLMVANMPALTGTNNWVVTSFPWLVILTVLIGMAIAYRMKGKHPDRYAALGMSIDPE